MSGGVYLRSNSGGLTIGTAAAPGALQTTSSDAASSFNIGANAYPNSPLVFGGPGVASSYSLKGVTGKMYFDWANIAGSNTIEFLDRNSITLVNSYARDLTDWGAAPISLPLGYMGSGMRARVEASAIPTDRTWIIGDIVWNTVPVASGFIGWTCVTAGTAGTLNGGATTGSITSGTTALVVNSATGLRTGQNITIAGVAGIKIIQSISGLNVTINTAASATVVAAAVAFSAPVFKTFGPISA
jgi:hypothetical protein